MLALLAAAALTLDTPNACTALQPGQGVNFTMTQGQTLDDALKQMLCVKHCEVKNYQLKSIHEADHGVQFQGTSSGKFCN